jgi:hypothetical protein
MPDDHKFLFRAEHYEKALAELKLLEWGYFIESGHMQHCPEIRKVTDLLEETIDRIGMA